MVRIDDALLRVRLVMRRVLEGEGSSLEQSPLAVEPDAIVELDRGCAFIYDNVEYGLVAGPASDGRADVVYEGLPSGAEVELSRVFDMAGIELDDERLRALRALARHLSEQRRA